MPYRYKHQLQRGITLQILNESRFFEAGFSLYITNEILDNYFKLIFMSWMTRPLHAASHAHLEKYIGIKLRGFLTKSSAEWGFVRLDTLTFLGRLFVVCRWTLNTYMAICCFSYLLETFISNSSGFPQNQALSGGGGGFVRLVHSNFEEGSFSFVVVSFINRWLIAASHFYFWKNSFKSNSEVFPPNQALSGDLYV